MHDRSVIVVSEIVSIRYVLIELGRHASLNVGPINFHKQITIFAALLVPKPDRVTDFVNCIAGGTTGSQADRLLTALHTDLGPAAACVAESDVIWELRRVGRSAQRRFKCRVRFPM